MKSIIYNKLHVLSAFAAVFCLSIISHNSAFSQSIDIDSRIYNHYSNQNIDEILAVDPIKIKKMNFYFRSSYNVLQNTSCNQCAVVDFNNFDITTIENKRMKDRRVKIILDQPCHVIELLSQTELMQAYQNIQQ